MNLNQRIQKIVNECSAAIARAVASSKASKASVAPKVVKRAAKTGPKSAAEMRCRHEYRGKRCEAKSRGPRFRYLCGKHCAK